VCVGALTFQAPFICPSLYLLTVYDTHKYTHTQTLTQTIKHTNTQTHRVGDSKECGHDGGNAVTDGFGRYRITEIEHRRARHYARHHCSGKDAGFRLGLGSRV
jgi:hypothetical protein